MLSHAPTGVLTEFGYTLREPCGRVHWAGTESSATMCGWIDGAIRSGDRAAENRGNGRTGTPPRTPGTGGTGGLLLGQNGNNGKP